MSTPNKLNQFGAEYRQDQPHEVKMHDVSEKPMPFMTITLDLESDWPAWTSTSGMRQWNHKLAPCCQCDISLDLMLSDRSALNITETIGPWKHYTNKDYQRDLAQHVKALFVQGLKGHICRLQGLFGTP
jgi:hypothetical protein